MSRWVWEKRPAPDALTVTLVSLGAIIAALIATGIIFSLYGLNPWQAYQKLYRTLLALPESCTLDTITQVSSMQALSKACLSRGFSDVLRKTIPLLLCGIGIVLALRAQFWNIGAEGQMLAGAVAASGVALFSGLQGPWLIPCMFLAGFIAGGLWGFLPAILKVRLGVNEIITTLMMNYIAINIVLWLINGPWKGQSTRGFARSDTFDREAWITTLTGTRLHYPTLFLGILLVILVAFLLARTKLGFEIRVMGASTEAAHYAGINFFRTTALLVLIAGGAAGLAGVGEVGGVLHRLDAPLSISQGYGYMAIIAALLARGRPLAVILSALFLGLIFAAGDVMKVSLRLPFQITSVISGLVLLFLICSEPLMHYRLRRIRRVPTEEAA